MAHAALTILFEDPFWVGIYEREEQGRYTAAKITFGAEPKDYEVYEFLQKNWHRLRFTPALNNAPLQALPQNPKRRSRLARRQTGPSGIGTKAQQALKLQQEQGKQARLARTRQQREAEEARKFQLRQARRKEKHRGH